MADLINGMPVILNIFKKEKYVFIDIGLPINEYNKEIINSPYIDETYDEDDNHEVKNIFFYEYQLGFVADDPISLIDFEELILQIPDEFDITSCTRILYGINSNELNYCHYKYSLSECIKKYKDDNKMLEKIKNFETQFDALLEINGKFNKFIDKEYKYDTGFVEVRCINTVTQDEVKSYEYITDVNTESILGKGLNIYISDVTVPMDIRVSNERLRTFDFVKALFMILQQDDYIEVDNNESIKSIFMNELRYNYNYLFYVLRILYTFTKPYKDDYGAVIYNALSMISRYTNKVISFSYDNEKIFILDNHSESILRIKEVNNDK